MLFKQSISFFTILISDEHYKMVQKFVKKEKRIIGANIGYMYIGRSN